MNTQTLINEIEADIRSAEEKGIQQIELKNLKAYVLNLKTYAEEQKEQDALQIHRDLAFYGAKNAARLEAYRAKVSRISNGFQAVIAIGQGALKICALINGGACFALLAFIGNILTKADAVFMVSGLSVALLIFAAGVFFAAAASGMTYLTQHAYETKQRKKANVFHRLTIAMVLLSYLSFLTGGIASYLTIKQWAPGKRAGVTFNTAPHPQR